MGSNWHRKPNTPCSYFWFWGVIISLLFLICGVYSTKRISVVSSVSSKYMVCRDNFLSFALSPRSIDKKRFDLTSDKLRNLAAALGPATLRIGGTMSNYLTFDPEAKDSVEQQKAVAKWASFTLTGRRWFLMGDFLSRIGWDIQFDFNHFKRKNGLWDGANAKQILKYSLANGVNISAFQLGNEVSSYRHAYNGTRNVHPYTMTRDLYQLRRLLNRFSAYRTKPIYGPEGLSISRFRTSRQYLSRFLKAGGGRFIDATSWHHYYISSITATVGQFLDVRIMDSLKSQLRKATRLSSQRGLPLAITETSSCHSGGAKGLADRYVAGFLWLDKLGVCALHNVSVVHRQTLYGGESYVLISYHRHHNDIFPNPDYFLSVLYKRLVLGPVLSARVYPLSPHLRLYAHCARTDVYRYPHGAVVLYYLNIRQARTTLVLTQYRRQDLQLFLLTPGDHEGITSKHVRLNGKVLAMEGDQVPAMAGRSHRGDVKVTGRSFGFIVIPNARLRMCMTSWGS